MLSPLGFRGENRLLQAISALVRLNAPMRLLQKWVCKTWSRRVDRRNQPTHSKVCGSILKLLKWHRHRLEICMSLLLEANARFEKQDSHVFLRMHLHQALHEILRNRVISLTCPQHDARVTHSDLIPVVILHLKGAQMVLQRHDQAVIRDKLLSLRTRHVCPRSESNNGGIRGALVLVAEGASIESLLRPSIVWCPLSSALIQRGRYIPLMANARFIASVFIFF